MIKLKSLLTERTVETPKFRFGQEIISFIDDNVPEWKKYKVKNAQYDDVHYQIPLNLVKQTFGWTEKHIKDIGQKLHNYEGWIDTDGKGNVLIGGGS
jgi:hypothetical protein